MGQRGLRRLSAAAGLALALGAAGCSLGGGSENASGASGPSGGGASGVSGASGASSASGATGTSGATGATGPSGTACTPKTCTGACGDLDDGCGRTLHCGTCASGCCDHNRCASGQALNACGHDGGACHACGSGQECHEGVCRVPPPCTAQSCPDGCCDGNACVAGNNAAACGDGGAACRPCPNGWSCNAHGACVSGSGGCMPSNCDGCCDAGTCYGGGTMQQCGKGGGACNDCAGIADGTVCAAGKCDLVDPLLTARAGVPCDTRDCPGSFECVQFAGGEKTFCSRPCGADAPCPAGTTCNPSLGLCLRPCTDDATCPADTRCWNEFGACIAPCVDFLSGYDLCGDGTTCSGYSGTCCTPENQACTSDAECCTGTKCIDGHCTAPASCAGDPCRVGARANGFVRGCCAATPYCTGAPGGHQWQCSGTCGAARAGCAVDADCCHGLTCTEHICADPSVDCDNQPCTAGFAAGGCCASSPQCSSASGQNLTCSRPYAMPAGSNCTAKGDCGDVGKTCRNGVCVETCDGDRCGRGSDCCSDAPYCGVLSRFASGYCMEFCSRLGGACSEGGCCAGLDCLYGVCVLR